MVTDDTMSHFKPRHDYNELAVGFGLKDKVKDLNEPFFLTT